MNVSIATLLRAINVKLRSMRAPGVTFRVDQDADKAERISNMIADVSGMIHSANFQDLQIEIDQPAVNPMGAHNIRSKLVAASLPNSEGVRVGIFEWNAYTPLVIGTYRDGDREWMHGQYCLNESEARGKFIERCAKYNY